MQATIHSTKAEILPGRFVTDMHEQDLIMVVDYDADGKTFQGTVIVHTDDSPRTLSTYSCSEYKVVPHGTKIDLQVRY